MLWIRSAILVLFFPLLLLAASSDVSAATVRVTVVDEEGTAVQRTNVWLRRIDGSSQPGNYRQRFRRALTDDNGVVEFTEVVSGQYRVEARPQGSFYIGAEANPLTAPAQLTVDSPAQVVEITLELHQGTRLCARFVIDGSFKREVFGKILRRELESGYDAEKGVEREEELCEQLFAGRWELRLEPPRGYLLVDVEVNGESIAGHMAPVDVREGSPAQYVTWYLLALARIEGRVSFEGERVGVAVQAELIEGTDWQPPADERGGSLYSPVLARPDPGTGLYDMDLPDGRWRLTAVGDNVREVDPEEVEIVVGRGENRWQDFTVRGEPGERGAGMVVSVVEPDGDRAVDSVVELWPADPDERGTEPIERARVPRWNMVRFSDLEPGSYRVVAGQRDFVEGAINVQFDPDDQDSRRHTIRLQEASELKIRLDTEIDPIDARMQLERSEEPPLESELADEKLLAELNNPAAELDATRRAWIRGIYPGEYTLRGSARNLFVEFKQDGRWSDELTLSFSAPEVREIEARAVPAGTLVASLFCQDGDPLPATADLRVLISTDRPADPLDRDWYAKAVLGGEVVLGGDRRDALELGPLDISSYLLAIQPATFDRWTWSVGTEDGHEAQSFEVASGEAVDLGAIGIECGPAIHLTVAVQSDRAAVDLSETRLKEDLRVEATITTLTGEELEVGRLRLERHRRLLTLRDLHEGEISGEVWIGHDYFVPQRWVAAPLTGELVRGQTLRAHATVVDLGGALELTGMDLQPAAMRLTDQDDSVRLEPDPGDSSRVTNLPVGTYTVELCVDAGCEQISWRQSGVEIEVNTTTELEVE